MSKQIKVGDTVWVTEHKSDKKSTPVPKGWYGEVLEIEDESTKVKDTNPDSITMRYFQDCW